MEAPCPAGVFHVTWVCPDGPPHTSAPEDSSETSHCETPCCICPRRGPSQCEKICGNGRWTLTNSLVVNTPMLTTNTSGFPAGTPTVRSLLYGSIPCAPPIWMCWYSFPRPMSVPSWGHDIHRLKVVSILQSFKWSSTRSQSCVKKTVPELVLRSPG